jgi:predicted nucleic acid-binding protein
MIHLDTNFLIQALTPNTQSAVQLGSWLAASEDIGISAVAWSEFMAGSANLSDLKESQQLLKRIEPLFKQDAEMAAKLFNLTGRRSRSLADCQIAATAMRCHAKLATLNKKDFVRFEIFGLELM